MPHSTTSNQEPAPNEDPPSNQWNPLTYPNPPNVFLNLENVINSLMEPDDVYENIQHSLYIENCFMTGQILRNVETLNSLAWSRYNNAEDNAPTSSSPRNNGGDTIRTGEQTMRGNSSISTNKKITESYENNHFGAFEANQFQKNNNHGAYYPQAPLYQFSNSGKAPIYDMNFMKHIGHPDPSDRTNQKVTDPESLSESSHLGASQTNQWQKSNNFDKNNPQAPLNPFANTGTAPIHEMNPYPSNWADQTETGSVGQSNALGSHHPPGFPNPFVPYKEVGLHQFPMSYYNNGLYQQGMFPATSHSQAVRELQSEHSDVASLPDKIDQNFGTKDFGLLPNEQAESPQFPNNMNFNVDPNYQQAVYHCFLQNAALNQLPSTVPGYNNTSVAPNLHLLPAFFDVFNQDNATPVHTGRVQETNNTKNVDGQTCSLNWIDVINSGVPGFVNNERQRATNYMNHWGTQFAGGYKQPNMNGHQGFSNNGWNNEKRRMPPKNAQIWKKSNTCSNVVESESSNCINQNEMPNSAMQTMPLPNHQKEPKHSEQLNSNETSNSTKSSHQQTEENPSSPTPSENTSPIVDTSSSESQISHFNSTIHKGTVYFTQQIDDINSSSDYYDPSFVGSVKYWSPEKAALDGDMRLEQLEQEARKPQEVIDSIDKTTEELTKTIHPKMVEVLRSLLEVNWRVFTVGRSGIEQLLAAWDQKQEHLPAEL